MKICKIFIRDFEQFQNVDLDFTDPETGEPLEKICFIGSNGTGKSKLLNMLRLFLVKISKRPEDILDSLGTRIGSKGKILFQVDYQKDSYFFLFYSGRMNLFQSNEKFLSKNQLAIKILETNLVSFSDAFWKHFTGGILQVKLTSEIKIKIDNKDLIIYSPAESNQNGYKNISDVPKTTVNEALVFSKEFPFYSHVSSDQVNVFWSLLVYNLRKRAEEREDFENLPENLPQTKQQLIKAFDVFYPKILEDLGNVWNRILSKAGLYFDVEGASNPYQLTDNLKAYIKLKNTHQIIPYSQLSTGIRNYIFRLGHIFSLYFNREIDRGFLLVDEPENSLYPDFLFDLIETYNQVIADKRGENNTQMFFSTHNPIIAAQFKPQERIILTWKEDGSVAAHKGITPEGDDPNDILKKDFGLHQLMGNVGINEWKKYLDLKKQLTQVQTVEEKMELASKINEIGTAYNFPA